MSANTNTPICNYCKKLGKSVAEYSHTIHKTKSHNSRITCPELLKRLCQRCRNGNHTEDKCKMADYFVEEVIKEIPRVCPEVNKQSTKFSSFVLEDSDSEDEKEPIIVSQIPDNDDW